MQVDVKKLKDCKVEIRVRETAEEMAKFRRKALARMSEHAKVPGFRPGTQLPESVIVANYGEEAVEEATMERALDALYGRALREAGVLPVERGGIKKVDGKVPLDVTIEVEVYPEVEVDEKKAAKVKLPAEKAEVSAAEAEKEIESWRAQLGTWKEEARAARDGDRATIDAQGYEPGKDGAAIPETKVASYGLVLGSGSFIPGFEEKLVGKAAGEEVSFEVTFPSDYHSKAFQNREVRFSAKVLKVEGKERPALDDAFAQRVRGPMATAAGLVEQVRKEMLEARESEARAKFEEALLEELLKFAVAEPGERLVAKETDRVFHEHRERLESDGMDFKHYLEHLKMDEAKFKEEKIKPVALRRLKAELILRKLKDERKPEVKDEEVRAEVDRLLARYADAAFRAKVEKEIYVPGTSYWEEVKSKIAYKKIVDSFVK